MNAPSATEIKATVLRIASMPSGSDIAGFTATFGFDAVAAVLTANDCDTIVSDLVSSTDALGPKPASEWMDSARTWRRLFHDIDGFDAGKKDVSVMSDLDARLVSFDSEEWPMRLNDLGLDAPVALWVIGKRHLADALQESVTVTGARAHTAYGDHIAADLGFDLVRVGSTVVGTGSFGISGAAHRGALAYTRDPDHPATTVAVFASGLDRPFPAAHRDLFDQITTHGGLLVSEFAPGLTSMRARYLRRSQVVAALTEATVVVEAAWRSGALTCAHHAQKLGRITAAMPGPISSAASSGAHALIRDTEASLVTSASDVLSLLRRTADKAV